MSPCTGTWNIAGSGRRGGWMQWGTRPAPTGRYATDCRISRRTWHVTCTDALSATGKSPLSRRTLNHNGEDRRSNPAPTLSLEMHYTESPDRTFRAMGVQHVTGFMAHSRMLVPNTSSLHGQGSIDPDNLPEADYDQHRADFSAQRRRGFLLGLSGDRHVKFFPAQGHTPHESRRLCSPSCTGYSRRRKA